MAMYSENNLNPKQWEAVRTTEGPVLVLAGAGSGKTRVLTERIAYLIREKNTPVNNILAFTFTNKAAKEMKARLEKMIPGVSDSLWVGTFHSTGVKILRKHGNRIGIPTNFSIYDSTDSLNLIKSVISLNALEGSVLKSAASLKDSISKWKCDLIDPAMASERSYNNIEKKSAFIYREYQKQLKQANALDFDDLIARPVQLFSAHADIRKSYARRFLYVLVDEFQDTNPIQMVLIDELSSYKRNLFVVGDDDQSIYSWRGAKVEHMLNFENLYSGTTMIRLEQNYRSTRAILEAANEVIKHNQGRKGKNLWTEGETGDKLRLIESLDEEGEAINILQAVKELGDNGIQYKDIAVLYRTNAQSRSLEEVMKMGSVPYQIIGSVRYYERAEIRDILAYCKLVVNHSDSLSLKRIINVPRRAIGKTSVRSLEEQAGKRGVSILGLLISGTYDLGKAQKKMCSAFVAIIEKLSHLAESENAPCVIEAILRETGYRKYLKEAYPDSDSRIENVEELVTAAYAAAETDGDKSLSGFLEQIALVSDIDGYDDERGQLTLMTLHNAKGLEFMCVIIAGMEEGLFPHFNSLENPASLEEERRLFYVGMTRAKKVLYLSCANMRRRMGALISNAPSRFLFEIPGELLDGTVQRGLAGGNSAFLGTFGDSSSRDRKTRRSIDTSYYQAHPDYETEPQETLAFKVGTRIFHENFGRGIVRKVEGKTEDLKLTVLFDSGGERKFIARFAPMRPL